MKAKQDSKGENQELSNSIEIKDQEIAALRAKVATVKAKNKLIKLERENALQ